jgi:hypothetical protein
MCHNKQPMPKRPYPELERPVIERSDGSTWEIAEREWILQGGGKSIICTCICGVEIKKEHSIINTVNGNRIQNIGRCCIKRFSLSGCSVLLDGMDRIDVSQPDYRNDADKAPVANDAVISWEKDKGILNDHARRLLMMKLSHCRRLRGFNDDESIHPLIMRYIHRDLLTVFRNPQHNHETIINKWASCTELPRDLEDEIYLKKSNAAREQRAFRRVEEERARQHQANTRKAHLEAQTRVVRQCLQTGNVDDALRINCVISSQCYKTGVISEWDVNFLESTERTRNLSVSQRAIYQQICRKIARHGEL